MEQDAKGLTAFDLKLIAIIAMTLDHLAWVFLANDGLLSEVLHLIGRLVAPLMCYLLVEGFHRSADVSSYLGRLLIFALLSQLPFSLYLIGIGNLDEADWTQFLVGNVLFSLAIALFSLRVWHKAWSWWQKLPIIMLMMLMVDGADYGGGLIFLALLFDVFYHQKQRLLMAYLLGVPVFYWLVYGSEQTVLAWWVHLGVLLIMPLIYGYDGRQGRRLGGRYFFYAFYPVHLLLIALLVWVYERLGGAFPLLA